MRIIDEKGKLFGKLNIIDLIAILIVLAVLALLGVKLTSGSGILGSGGQRIVYTVKVPGVDADVYHSIQQQLPSQLMAAEEMQNGYVTAVEGIPVEEESYLLEDNISNNTTRLYHEEQGTYTLIFTIEATIQDTLTSKIGSQEIRVGKSHIVKTTTFELEGGVILTREDLPSE